MKQTVPQEVLDYVSSLEPGYFPFELFQHITRLTVSPIVELVPLRKMHGGIEVLMLKREEDDPHWPGMLHTPGTYLRPTDTERTLDSAFQRLFLEEMELDTVFQPFFVHTIFHKVTRGMELSLVYYVDLTALKTITKGTWFSVHNVPENSVKTQYASIYKAAELLERNFTARSSDTLLF